MTKIGGQCEGCSHAYWEGLSRAKTPTSDSSVAAEEESLPEAASRASSVNADKGTIYNDPERALMNAVSRLTEIQTELSSQDNSNTEMVTGTASHVVSHDSHDGLRQEQQILSARINAIYRCIGLLESHQKVFKAVRDDQWYRRRERIRETVQRSYFRSLPYYQILLKCKYRLPGIEDLLLFMDETFSNKVSSLVTIYELCSGAKSTRIGHEFRLSDLAQLLYHWDILHNFDTPDGYATRPVVLVDGVDSPTMEIFGNALKLHPVVFVRHLWRNLRRDDSDSNWEGYPLSQTPLCSLADKHSPRIVLDVEECMSLRSLDGTSLNGLEDLRSIETLGELHGRREIRSARSDKPEIEESLTRINLEGMRSTLGYARYGGNSFVADCAKLETPILTRVSSIPYDTLSSEDTSVSTTVLELCASATICTISQHSQQNGTRTLVLRTPSSWHKSTVARINWSAGATRDLPFSHDPFKTGGLSLRKDVESRGSIFEALYTVVGLYATATTQLDQTEVSIIVSLSLLKVSLFNVWNLAVSDHLMLVDSGQNFMYENLELVEVSDGCSAYLVQRCQRQRDALLLAAAVAEKLYLAAAGSASSAFVDHVKQELDRIRAIKTKIESQLQQTEKVLTVRIDQTFRDLQVTLAKTQLEESRKAIKQADTVARLTILAFVFIPISAVCGFFGMNIIEVAADGGFSFWVFGTTMGTVLAMTFLLAFADSIYTIWNYYAWRIDYNMYIHMNIGYPPRLLTRKIPYLFRWISLKIKRTIASGQDTRTEDAKWMERKIDRGGHV